MDVSEGSQLPAVPLQSQREQTIAALCEHFSRDNLTLDEFERRLDLAHRVQTTPELTQLLQGLPALPVQPTAAGGPRSANTSVSSSTSWPSWAGTTSAACGGRRRRRTPTA